ncbi:MAG TPA: TadE/TadG family type IV pilus assembly protein [Magnetospirillaceae bacterium]|nr:TadE/TadG family type IV pilus assembly protein [Magnetospirillaceae bacterium]
MMTLRSLRGLPGNRDGVAFVEFALLAPVFALLTVAAIDFGLAFAAKLNLAAAVAEGAQYAFLNGGNVQAARVQTVVQSAIALSPVSATVTYDGACYCVTGSPPARSAQTCGVPCPNGAPPGKYLDISASYTYQPIFPSYALVSNPHLTETVTVRVQ